MQSLEKLKPLALLFLRAALGVIFIYNGYPKLFGHTREAIQTFVHLGFPSYFAYIAGVVEFFGGCLLIAGLFTRVVGLLLAVEMAVAVVQAGKIITEPRAVNNYQFPLALAAAAFALATLGAGLISLDQIFFPEGRSSPRRARGKD
jgi:putative oxidoreductase